MFTPAQDPSSDEPLRAAEERPSRLALTVQLGSLALIIVLAVGPPLYSMIHSAAGAATFDADYWTHVRLIQTALKDGSWQPHFLFQRLVWAAAGFSADTTRLSWAMWGVVLAGVFAKAALTYLFYARTFAQRPRWLGISPSTLGFGLALASLMLMPISTPLTLDNMYMGLIAPNVWHNPTSLIAWPVMMALFFAGARYLDVPARSTLALISALLVLNVVTKPNSVMVFLPAFAVVCLVRQRSLRTLAWTALALVPVMAALVIQWRWTYSHNALLPTASTHIVFAPFQAWRPHTSSIALSIVRSIAFPAAYMVLYLRRALRSPLLGLAWATFLVALLWVALAGESGPRMGHFNFSWGAHLASYILFIVTIADWLRGDLEPTPASPAPHRLPRDLALAALLVAHVLSGTVYFLRIAIGLPYL